jgi:glycosyltransferase involved in cell wall biosynthesis
MAIKKDINISAIIIAKDEEEVIAECLESVSWVDEIVVIDTGSKDKTLSVCKNKNAKVYEFSKGSYQDWRNEGLKKANGNWILYVDADERVTPLLRKEIMSVVEKDSKQYSSYAVPRRNIILGKEMKYGGWWPDYVKRLFKKSELKKWTGDLHEEPVFEGKMGHLSNSFIHIKHSNLSDMVEKTNKWSKVEAKMLFESDHPQMTWWRFFRVMATELWYRLIKLQGFRDGIEGVVYSIYQMWSKFITYGKLWEMQRNVE